MTSITKAKRKGYYHTIVKWLLNDNKIVEGLLVMTR